jgi:hypothetical protein
MFSLGARSLTMCASPLTSSGRCWDADNADAWPERTRLLPFQATISTARAWAVAWSKLTD